MIGRIRTRRDAAGGSVAETAGQRRDRTTALMEVLHLAQSQ
jgi:hypothetical protein